jgi:hypothetical protein
MTDWNIECQTPNIESREALDKFRIEILLNLQVQSNELRLIETQTCVL